MDRHCTKLDTDLQKYEDEQLIGPTRKMGVATISSTAAAAGATSVTSTDRTDKLEQGIYMNVKRRERKSVETYFYIYI